MDHFKFSIGVPALNKLGDQIPLSFTITNVSHTDIAILKRFLPLEGIKGNIFKVLDASGKQLRYDGRLVKRSAPLKEEYIVVKQGESISQVIDLSDYYFFEKDGKYKVELATKIQDFILLDSPEKEASIGKNESYTSHKVSPEQSIFEIEASEKDAKPTLGMQARIKEGRIIKLRDKKSSDSQTEEKPKPPKIDGGSPSQQKTIIAAHELAYQKTCDSISTLIKGGSKNPAYLEWFGTYSAFNADVVNDIYQAVSSSMESDTITYNLSGDECEPGDFAYTYYQSRTIYLCSAFWSATNSGFDTQYGTIIHELTHATSDTEDITYGVVEAKELAEDNPQEAIDNADNFEYYSESMKSS